MAEIPMTVEEVRAFIAAHEWRFAKTMPRTPHWYVTRERARDVGEFQRVVAAIRALGEARRWHGHIFTYLDLDGYCYWTMGAPIEATIIINRAKLEG